MLVWLDKCGWALCGWTCVAGHCVASYHVAFYPMSRTRTGPAWGPPPRAATGRPGGPGARRPPRSPGCRPCRPRTRAAAPTRAAPSPRRCRARTTPSSTCPRSLRAAAAGRARALRALGSRHWLCPAARVGAPPLAPAAAASAREGAMRHQSRPQMSDLAQRCPGTGPDTGLS